MTGLKNAIERIEEERKHYNEGGGWLDVISYDYVLKILKEEAEKEIFAKRLPDGLYNKT